MYAVNESGTRGSISVYDIDNGHKLLKTIQTISGISDVRGVAASAVSGKLYVSYRDGAGKGHVFCLDIATGAIRWNNAYSPNVDRLAVSPDGQLLYVPTGEEQYDNYINVVDANSGAVIRTVTIPSIRSHDTLFPLSGPIFQETKATDGTGKYLYMIDPQSYAVSKVGPFHDFLGPYAVDYSSRYAVADVNGVVGFQVVDLQTNTIATAKIPNPPSGVGLPHGIGWTPDISEVWQNTTGFDPHIYVWDMTNPMQPVFKQRFNLDNGGSHWLTFDIKGDYAYIAPNKNSGNGTDIVKVATHAVVGKIASSEDMLEVDFDANGKVSAVGDQYGIGR
jgi:DNA-binding beta-propeller fold protein YncE